VKRSILLSFLIIAVAGTILAVAGTQAFFDDTQTASGDVNAGTLSLHLSEGVNGDDNADDEFIFEVAENLVPGQTATETLELLNNGNTSWKIDTITPVITPDAECDASNGVDDWTAAINGAGLATGTTVTPGNTTSGTVDVTLVSSADNDCQGDLITVTVTVHVVSP
jgi:hypothetical protein